MGNNTTTKMIKDHHSIFSKLPIELIENILHFDGSIIKLRDGKSIGQIDLNKPKFRLLNNIKQIDELTLTYCHGIVCLSCRKTLNDIYEVYFYTHITTSTNDDGQLIQIKDINYKISKKISKKISENKKPLSDTS
jgi:hypothetical protein